MAMLTVSDLWCGWWAVPLVLLSVALCSTCGAQDARAPTAPGPDTAFRPDFFPINPWGSHFRAGLGPMAECNFTTAGFFVDPKDIPYCNELGLKPLLWSGLPRNYGNLVTMSDEDIDTQIKKAVWETRNDPDVLGYFLIDEPGAIAFHALGVAVAAVKKYAPGKLAYINLFPVHARTSIQAKATGHGEQLWTETYTEYLERYVNEVKPQMISYDNYQVLNSMDLKSEAGAAGYFDNLFDVRRVALKYDLPFWNFVGCCHWGNQTVPSPGNLALQAYTSLAAGARGLSWYRYYNGHSVRAPIDHADNNNRSLTWYWLQNVNRQVLTLAPTLLKLTSTGVHLTTGDTGDGASEVPGRLVRKLQSEAPMMIGEFKHEDGADYVMVVNVNLQSSAHFTIETVDHYDDIRIIPSVEHRAELPPLVPGHWLVPGQGVLIKLGTPAPGPIDG